MVSLSAQVTNPREHDHQVSPPSLLYEDVSLDQRHEQMPSTHNKNSMSVNSAASEVSTGQRMISATWGSTLTSLLVTPLDVVRVRLQSQPTPVPIPHNLSHFPAYATNFAKLPPGLGVKACCREVFWVGDNAQFCLAGNGNSSTAMAADCAVEETQKKTFNSTLDGIRKIARNEGISTLWRGLSPTLVMSIPANVIYFTGYDWLRYNEASPIKMMTGDAYVPLASGAVARVLSAIAVSPIEMLRTRIQASSASSDGLMKDTIISLHKMTQTQGYSSLWRGLTLTMWRDVPFSAVYWWGYEELRSCFSLARTTTKAKLTGSEETIKDYRILQHEESHTTTFIDSFTAGGLSGGISALITTPFDVGKTRQQVFIHAGDDASSAALAAKEAAAAVGKIVPEELPMLKFLYHIFKEEGTSGLFKGWAARCLKVAPACAIMVSSYEVGKRLAHSANTKKDERSRTL